MAAAATDAAILKKMFGSDSTTLIISNNIFNYWKKIKKVVITELFAVSIENLKNIKYHTS